MAIGKIQKKTVAQLLVSQILAATVTTEYRFVKRTAADTVGDIAALTDEVYGIREKPGTAADAVQVALPGCGVQKITLGGSVTQGESLTHDATGRAVTAHPGQVIHGTARSSGTVGNVGFMDFAPKGAMRGGPGYLAIAVDRTTGGSNPLTLAEMRTYGVIEATKGSAQEIELATPAAADAGLRLTFYRSTNASALTLSTSGAEHVIGGDTFASCDAVGDTVTIVWNGTEWLLTAKNIA